MAVGAEVQTSLEVISTVTLLPSVRVEVVKVGLLVPTLFPFTFHWYIGVVPPLVGVAVKVIEFPGQISVSVAETVTDGVTIGRTIMEIALLSAVEGDVQL